VKENNSEHYSKRTKKMTYYSSSTPRKFPAPSRIVACIRRRGTEEGWDRMGAARWTTLRLREKYDVLPPLATDVPIGGSRLAALGILPPLTPCWMAFLLGKSTEDTEDDKKKDLPGAEHCEGACQPGRQQLGHQ
jgi:hypothetical protein